MTFEPGPWLDRSEASFQVWKDYSRLKRRHLLEVWLGHYAKSADDLAYLVTGETGKPIRLAKAEIQRGVATLQAAVEAVSALGDVPVPYDLMPGADGCRAALRRFPRGPVLAITPFNSPVNLALHKLAPALGAGCPVIWKPSPLTPEVSKLLLLGFEKARLEVGGPRYLIQIAQVGPEDTETLAKDPRIAAVSFTGSETVGLHLRSLITDKPLVLELGGNAAVVLDEGIDVARAVKHLVPAAMFNGGQSSSKAQRFYVHQNLWEAFLPAFVEGVKSLTVGDPMNPATVVGPLVSEANAIHIDELVDGSLALGARAVLRGQRKGSLLPPIILTDVPGMDPLAAEEIFSPIAILNRVERFEEGLEAAVDTRFGLCASAYSRDARHLQLAASRLRAGSVMLNLPPNFRLESAPFGGLNHSGQGFEGPRWAMEHFLETRLVVEGPA